MFLVTGANGQLGNELKLLLQDKAVYVDRAELDITDAEAVQAYAAKQKWEAIINCAAYTAVDKAESDAETAEKINVLGPENLAKTGIPLIQISTDYVFDGRNCRPYNEDDEPHPQSVYGRTKLAGEQAVLQNAATAVIIRTAWLYSTFGNNFVKTMRRLGKERASLNVVLIRRGRRPTRGIWRRRLLTFCRRLSPVRKKFIIFPTRAFVRGMTLQRRLWRSLIWTARCCRLKAKIIRRRRFGRATRF